MTVLVCDLGGSRWKIGVVRDGRLLSATTLPVRNRRRLAGQLPALRAAWQALLKRLGLRLRDCAGVSVAYPGLVDRSTGQILTAHGKYLDGPEVDLRQWGRVHLNLPLALENDARMAVVGEWQRGAGRGCHDLVMLLLGTGLGVGVVIEGRVLRGRHGQAGVMSGHLTVRYGGRRCYCGNEGCAEAEASTAFLEQMAVGLPEWKCSSLFGGATLNYAEVFKHAAAGDPCAVRLRDHSLQVWSALAVNLVHAFDPERLILGGGIMGNGAVVLPAVRAYVRKRAHTPWGQVRVVASELGDHAALFAGEWVLREQFPDLPPS